MKTSNEFELLRGVAVILHDNNIMPDTFALERPDGGVMGMQWNARLETYVINERVLFPHLIRYTPDQIFRMADTFLGGNQ